MSIFFSIFLQLLPKFTLIANQGRGVNLEQAFGRYSLNRDFQFFIWSSINCLGYDADEAPGLCGFKAYVSEKAYWSTANGKKLCGWS